MAVVALSLAAALCFAIGVVLQQHAAAAQPIEHHLRPSLVIRLAKRPLWLCGVAAGAIGTLVQLLALWRGALVTVQPLLVCGLLFALPINAIWLHRRRPRTSELAAAGAVCVGLAVFLLATDPRPGRATAGAAGWVAVLGAITAAVVVLIASSRASRGALRCGLLAAAAGVINGLSAAFAKGVARSLAAHWHRGALGALTGAFANWELYAFGACLLVVTVIVQSAFQTGPIRWSLPSLTATNPVASVILGAVVLGEEVRSSDLALAGAAIGLLLVVGGILALSSSNLITGGADVTEDRPPVATGAVPTGAVPTGAVPVGLPVGLPAGLPGAVVAVGPTGVVPPLDLDPVAGAFSTSPETLLREPPA